MKRSVYVIEALTDATEWITLYFRYLDSSPEIRVGSQFAFAVGNQVRYRLQTNAGEARVSRGLPTDRVFTVSGVEKHDTIILVAPGYGLPTRYGACYPAPVLVRVDDLFESDESDQFCKWL